jgi:hypothetical protein
MRQSSKNRLPSRINSDSDSDSDSNGNGNGNRTTAAMKQRVFKWSVSYDTIREQAVPRRLGGRAARQAPEAVTKRV